MLQLMQVRTQIVTIFQRRGEVPATALAGEPQLPDSGAAVPMESEVADSHKRHELEASLSPGSPKKQRTGEEQPVTPADDLMESFGESAPKTPKLSESPRQQQMMQITSTDLSFYEHEDAAVKVDFSLEELDSLEKYEMEFYDDELLERSGNSTTDDDAQVAKLIEQLTFPYTSKEPNLPAEELMALDAIADQVELQRLEKLGVLQSPDKVPSSSKVLSTRFVRTWREKHNKEGLPVWLRRSRFVAREFSWLEPERENLFSPASGSIISRILPTIFLQRREAEDMILASLDVRDAFLTVSQETPTLVHTKDAGGTAHSFSLGKVLPGQRDGSLLWYQAITGFLKTALDMEECPLYPCILKTKDMNCHLC